MASLLDTSTKIFVRPSIFDSNLAECGLCDVREPTGVCGISQLGRGGNHSCDYNLTKAQTKEIVLDPSAMESFLKRIEL